MFDVGDYVTNFGVLVEQEKFQMTIFFNKYWHKKKRESSNGKKSES